jgi:hypothetical protein
MRRGSVGFKRGYGLRATGYGLRATGYGLRATRVSICLRSWQPFVRISREMSQQDPNQIALAGPWGRTRSP